MLGPAAAGTRGGTGCAGRREEEAGWGGGRHQSCGLHNMVDLPQVKKANWLTLMARQRGVTPSSEKSRSSGDAEWTEMPIILHITPTKRTHCTRTCIHVPARYPEIS